MFFAEILVYPVIVIAFGSSLRVEDSGVLPIQRGDILMLFYLTLRNDCEEPVHVEARGEHCCDTLCPEDPTACEFMRLTGGHMGTFDPREKRNITLFFVTPVPHGRRGRCDVELWFGRQGGDTRAINHRVTFDTVVSPSFVPPVLAGYYDPSSVQECETPDQDPLDDCEPVDCRMKYGGARPFFSAPQSRCVAAPACADADSAYDPADNSCRDLRADLSDEELRVLSQPGGPPAADADAPSPYLPLVHCHHGRRDPDTGLCECDEGWASARMESPEALQASTFVLHQCTERKDRPRTFWKTFCIPIVLGVLTALAAVGLSLASYHCWLRLGTRPPAGEKGPICICNIIHHDLLGDSYSSPDDDDDAHENICSTHHRGICGHNVRRVQCYQRSKHGRSSPKARTNRSTRDKATRAESTNNEPLDITPTRGSSWDRDSDATTSKDTSVRDESDDGAAGGSRRGESYFRDSKSPMLRTEIRELFRASAIAGEDKSLPKKPMYEESSSSHSKHEKSLILSMMAGDSKRDALIYQISEITGEEPKAGDPLCGKSLDRTSIPEESMREDRKRTFEEPQSKESGGSSRYPESSYEESMRRDSLLGETTHSSPPKAESWRKGVRSASSGEDEEGGGGGSDGAAAGPGSSQREGSPLPTRSSAVASRLHDDDADSDNQKHDETPQMRHTAKRQPEFKRSLETSVVPVRMGSASPRHALALQAARTLLGSHSSKPRFVREEDICPLSSRSPCRRTRKEPPPCQAIPPRAHIAPSKRTPPWARTPTSTEPPPHAPTLPYVSSSSSTSTSPPSTPTPPSKTPTQPRSPSPPDREVAQPFVDPEIRNCSPSPPDREAAQPFVDPEIRNSKEESFEVVYSSGSKHTVQSLSDYTPDAPSFKVSVEVGVSRPRSSSLPPESPSGASQLVFRRTSSSVDVSAAATGSYVCYPPGPRRICGSLWYPIAAPPRGERESSTSGGPAPPPEAERYVVGVVNYGDSRAGEAWCPHYHRLAPREATGAYPPCMKCCHGVAFVASAPGASCLQVAPCSANVCPVNIRPASARAARARPLIPVAPAPGPSDSDNVAYLTVTAQSGAPTESSQISTEVSTPSSLRAHGSMTAQVQQTQLGGDDAQRLPSPGLPADRRISPGSAEKRKISEGAPVISRRAICPPQRPEPAMSAPKVPPNKPEPCIYPLWVERDDEEFWEQFMPRWRELRSDDDDSY